MPPKKTSNTTPKNRWFICTSVQRVVRFDGSLFRCATDRLSISFEPSQTRARRKKKHGSGSTHHLSNECYDQYPHNSSTLATGKLLLCMGRSVVLDKPSRDKGREVLEPLEPVLMVRPRRVSQPLLNRVGRLDIACLQQQLISMRVPKKQRRR